MFYIAQGGFIRRNTVCSMEQMITCNNRRKCWLPTFSHFFSQCFQKPSPFGTEAFLKHLLNKRKCKYWRFLLLFPNVYYPSCKKSHYNLPVKKIPSYLFCHLQILSIWTCKKMLVFRKQLTFSLIQHFEIVQNSKKLQTTTEIWLFEDFNIQVV